MRTLTRWFAGVGLGLAIAAAPAVATAGVVTFWPDDFIQEDRTPIVEQGPAGLVAEGSFYTILRLPVGSVIDRFKVTFSASEDYFDWCTYIRRVKLGSLPEDILSFGRTDFDPYPPIIGITTMEGYSLPLPPAALRRVTRGYRYYLHLDPDNALGKIYSVQVFYH